MNDKTTPQSHSTFATSLRSDPDATQPQPDAGSIGPYRLMRELGRGGMGAVYLATHVNLQRTMAVKILPPEFANSAERLDRFRREMAAIGRLEHPNIVLATDAGQHDGTAYIAMQFLDGSDLGAILKRERALAIADAAEIVRRTALGLQHICEAGLVHRDIKPSNLFLTRLGEVKILDLGLAMLRDNQGLSAAITSPNTIMGTPDYIAPEQINSSHQVDIRADIYSLGCTFYALLAGKAPFEGQEYTTTTSKLVAHAEKQAVSLKSVRPDVPEPIVEMVERMMAKSADKRFAQPQQIADMLTKWSQSSNLLRLANPHTIEAGPALGQPIVTARKNSQLMVLVGAVCGVAAVGAAVVFLRPAPREGSSPTASSQAPLVDKATIVPAVKSSDSIESSATTAQQTTATGAPAVPPATPTTIPTPPPAVVANIDSSLQQISKSAQSIEASNQKVEENTRKIAQSFDELVKQLSSASASKPVSDPRTPGEHYYNALVYGMQGNARMARQAFLSYFELDQDYIDPHLKFIELLTLQEGKSSARELYGSLAGDKALLSRQFAEATLLEPEARQAALLAIAATHESFAPAWYALSSLLSASSGARQTLHDLDQELKYLRKFVAAHQRGGLLKYYLDQSEAAKIVQRADSRLKELEQIEKDKIAKPVSLSTVIKVADNWQVALDVAEPAKELFYRLGETGEFTSMGKSFGIDSATAYPLLNKSFLIPGNVQTTVIHVKYLDMKDHLCGPFPLPFDAREQTVKWEMSVVQQTKSAWLRLQEDRLFFDVFHAGRSVLKEVRYGVDVEQPNKTKAVPAAALSGENAQAYFEAVPTSSKYAVVQVIFADGTRSEVVRIERR